MNKALALGLALAAGCGSSSEGVASDPLGATTLNASGATFQQAVQEVSIEVFRKAHPRVKINYGAGGSGKGRQDFADQVVDYACTDAPYKAGSAAPKGGAFFYIPNVIGAITVSYNLPGVKLKLGADALAKIFSRQITTWNDPVIAADNPGVTLPSKSITVARRSDGSGTTENFTKFLTTSQSWTLGSGSTVAWPNDTQAGNGNGGVAQIVKSTKGAIGYVDLSDAKASGLTYAWVKNASGAYIEPTVAATTAAAEGITPTPELIYSVANPKAPTAYPIAAASWCLIYAQQTDKVKGAAIKEYFRYMITDGQKVLPEIDFAPIPKALADQALAQIDKVVVP